MCQARRELTETQLRQEADNTIKEQVQAELTRLRQLDEHKRRLHEVKTAIEDLLTLKCPRCNGVVGTSIEGPFFNACAAIACSRCPFHFCGWCLEDCGRSMEAAHRHVARCAFKPPNVDALYPGDTNDPRGAFRQHWQRTTARKVREALAAARPRLSAQDRRDVLQMLRVQLADIEHLLQHQDACGE